MTDLDKGVERVLAGLREAAVPAGIEERVLRTVRAREVARAQERGWWPMWLGGMRAYGAVGVLVVLVALATVTWHGMRRRGELAGKKTAVQVEAPAAVARMDRAGAVTTRSGVRRTLEEKGQRMRRRNAVGESSAWAVSFPAPPLPLTEQERLLLRVVHGHDPVEMAMLRPGEGPKRIAKDKAEFEKFFGSQPKEAVNEIQVR